MCEGAAWIGGEKGAKAGEGAGGTWWGGDRWEKLAGGCVNCTNTIRPSANSSCCQKPCWPGLARVLLVVVGRAGLADGGERKEGATV
jgi:hypothetical protein